MIDVDVPPAAAMVINDFDADAFAFPFMDIPKFGAERFATARLDVTSTRRPNDGEYIRFCFRQEIHAGVVPSAAANQKADVRMFEREHRREEFADGTVAAVIAVDKPMALVFRDMHLIGKGTAGRLVAKGRAYDFPVAVVVAFKIRDKKVLGMQ